MPIKKHRTYKKRFLFFTLFILLTTASFSAKTSTGKDKKRVLFISSYSYAWETVPEQIDGIRDALDSDVQLDYKFMDTKNCTSPKSEKLFYESMKEYFSSVPSYDALIVGDDAAFQFALKYRKEFFANIPIAFEGVNDMNVAKTAARDPLICGVTEKLSYQNTIALASRLCPDAKKIVAVLDDTITGQGERKDFYSHQKDFPNLAFEEINVSRLTQKKFRQALSSLDRQSILLYVMCSANAEGHNYVGTEGIELVSRTAKIPTFTIVSIGMGHGFLGGEIVSQREMGRIAADMVQQYLDGGDFSSIKLETNSPRTYRFDENVLNKFRISSKKLPENSEIINHNATFFEQNAVMIRICIIGALFFLTLVCLLLLNNLRQHRLNVKLQKVEHSLQKLVKYDSLTGLQNRALFMSTISKKIENNESFSLILYDIDHFKTINDTLGHNNGDIVLKETAVRTLRICDSRFTIYRLGGDEFTALVDSDNPEVITAYIKKIQEAFSQPFVLEKQEHHLHSSIGAAIFPQDADNQTDLIAAADQAMYMVKKNGRNAYTFYHSSEIYR